MASTPSASHISSTLFTLYTFLFLSSFSFCSARDTITFHNPITDSQRESLVSAGERFELGFFPPYGRSSEHGRYVGIWYYKSSPRVVVWVANRDKPLSQSTGTGAFSIAEDGDLQIVEDNNTLWSTNTGGSSTSFNMTTVKLLESGNLVLIRSERILWQSFDHPTDTFLPGMKLTAGMNLTSWTSQDDPAPGDYTFQEDQVLQNQYIIRKGPIPYWKSEVSGKFFNSDSICPRISSLLSNITQNYKLGENMTRDIDYYGRRLVMDVDGHIKLYSSDNMTASASWTLNCMEPRDNCSMYLPCGNFGICNTENSPMCRCLNEFVPKAPVIWNSGIYSGGCTRNSSIGSKGDFFLNLKIMRVGAPGGKTEKKSAKQCKEECLNISNCQAYSHETIYSNETIEMSRQVANTNTCWIWSEDLNNIQEYISGGREARDLYVRVGHSDLGNIPRSVGGGIPGSLEKHSRRKMPLSLIVVVSLISVTVLSCTIIFLYIWRRKMAKRQENRNSNKRDRALRKLDSERHVKDLIDSGEFREEGESEIDLPFFDLESILAATDNFSDANKLGQGGYGPVYKGTFPGDQEIAIKRLSSVSRQGLQEFKNEVVLIAKLQHRNLVRLRGYCTKGDEKILLYEYMPNKSLDSFIFDQKLSVLLDWDMRFNIILGIARGLLYLHQDSRLRIIHRDLKTSNILLDQEMNPKISDFGLARIVGGNEIEANTTRVVGTYGYMSPEYALDGVFSIKSDVFSFGVVLLEIISGKKNTGFYRSEQAMSLIGYAWRLWTENKVLDLMDQTIHETLNAAKFMKCVNVGLLCIQEDPNDRPTMSNVITMLDSETGTVPTPKQPAFVLKRGQSSTASSSSRPETYTEFTTSVEEAQ